MSTSVNSRTNSHEFEDTSYPRLSDYMSVMLYFRTLFGYNEDAVAAATDLASTAPSIGASVIDDRALQHRFSRRRPRSFSRAHIVQQLTEECMCCLIIPLFFFFLVALSMIVGQYRSMMVDLQSNVSRILDNDLVYIKNIVNDKTKHMVAPVLYGFAQRPELNKDEELFYDRKYHLMSSDYQNWNMWLNNGSKVELKYDIISTRIFYILLVVLQGKETLQDWTSDPLNARLATSWHYVHGSGVINFKVEKDGDYYVTFGNLNDYSVEVRLQATVHSKLYDTGTADLSCSLRENFCGLNLLFPGFKYAIISTPEQDQEQNQKGSREWQVEMIYGKHWIIYLVLIGFVLSMAFISLKVIDKMFHMISIHNEASREASSITSTTNGLREPLLEAQHASSILDDFEADEIMSEDGKRIYASQFCAICCNETRSTFFHPCGHCVTCYPCGLRIKNGDSNTSEYSGKCPICRLEIQEVKKIFTV